MCVVVDDDVDDDVVVVVDDDDEDDDDVSQALLQPLKNEGFSQRSKKGFPMVFPAGRLWCRLWLGLLVGDLPPCTAARFVEMDGIYSMANPTITPDA